MRIAVIGAGGVGGYFGGLLAREGHKVTFVARGEHGATLRRTGLRVHSVHGDFELPVSCVETPGEAGTADIVLFCVKSYDTGATATAIAPLLHERSIVVSLQNGIENAGEIAGLVGPACVLTGLVWVESTIAAPGVISQTSRVRRVAIGPHDGTSGASAEAVTALLASAGADAEAHADIRPILWDKLLFISSVSGITCVTRSSLGPIMATPAARELLVQALDEARRVANAGGVALDQTNVDAALDLCVNLGSDFKTSMLRDLERGRRLEVNALSGAIVRAAHRSGIRAPIHEFICGALAIVAGGR